MRPRLIAGIGAGVALLAPAVALADDYAYGVRGRIEVDERNSDVEAMETRRARLIEDVQREQQHWRDERQRLPAERATLSPEQVRSRERDLQDRITDSQRALRESASSIPCPMSQGYTTRSDAETFARRNLGGVGGSCSCR